MVKKHGPIIWTDGDDLLGERTFLPKLLERPQEGGDLTPVTVQAHEDYRFQYIGIWQNGNRVFLDEEQITDLVKWLTENEIIF